MKIINGQTAGLRCNMPLTFVLSAEDFIAWSCSLMILLALPSFPSFWGEAFCHRGSSISHRAWQGVGCPVGSPWRADDWSDTLYREWLAGGWLHKQHGTPITHLLFPQGLLHIVLILPHILEGRGEAYWFLFYGTCLPRVPQLRSDRNDQVPTSWFPILCHFYPI